MGGASTRRGSKLALLGALLAFVLCVGVALWFVASPRSASSEPQAARHRGEAPTAPAPELAPSPAVGADRAAAGDGSVVDPPPLGDLFALLAWLEKPDHGPLPAVVADASAFDHLFASQHSERWVEATAQPTRIGEHWSEGAVLAFDPGVWRLENVLPDSGALPPDVTLAGSGMTRTLLIVGGLKPSARLARFTLRDCTLFTDNQALFDMPGELAALTCERARIVGFDSGLAPSPFVRARGLGVQMRDCELLGGYGRAPGSGSLFHVPSSALLARFDRCRFAGLRLGLEAFAGGVTLACVDGTTEQIVEDPAAALATHAGITFTNTPLALLAAGQRPPSRDLEQLFKNWRKLLK